MNLASCASNQIAWDANCTGRGYTIPVCPCVLPSTNTLSCFNGQCGYW